MNTIYLDVRTPEEFSSGHYPNAINHPVELLMDGKFPDESLVPKDADIRVYCQSGGRAGVAKQILDGAGYEDVENMGGLGDLVAHIA